VKRPVMALYALDQDPETTSSLGIYHYTRNLIAGFAQMPDPGFFLELWVSSVNADGLISGALPEWMRVIRVPGRYGRGVRRLLADHVVCRLLCILRRPRAVHFPKGFPPFFLPRRIGCVVTLCDAIVDYYQKHYPGTFSRLKTAYFQFFSRYALCRADAVITLSNASAEELAKLVPGKRVAFSIIPPGGMPGVMGRGEQDRSGILVFGSRLPHKGTAEALHLLDVFARESGFDEEVTVVGVAGAKDVPGLGETPFLKLQWAGYVSDDTLQMLLEQSRVSVVASEVEGFGLPLLESYAVGTPVCYRNQSAIAEVMHGAPGGWSGSSDSFPGALQNCLCMSVQDINHVQQDLALRYNWNDAINATCGVYKRTMSVDAFPAGFWIIAFCLAFPSLTIFKHFGLKMISGYVLFVLSALFVFRKTTRIWQGVLTGWRGAVASGVGLLAFLIAYLLVHPLIAMDGFAVFGRSFGASDADHALDVAVSALRAGVYPYYEKTFLGNPITPMPGALFLAVPFHFLGNVGLQNFFWLLLLVCWIAKRACSWVVAATLIGVVCLLSPNVAYTTLTGSDHVANAIYVMLVGAFALESAHHRKHLLQTSFACACFGLVMSSRANFVLLFPLWGGCLLAATDRNWHRTTVFFAIAVLVFVGVTFPFYLYDPGGFSPLHTADKLRAGGQANWAPVLIPALAGVLSFLLGVFQDRYRQDFFFRAAFVVQAAVIVSSFLLDSFLGRRPAWGQTHFGIFFMFFGLVAWWPVWVGYLLRGSGIPYSDRTLQGRDSA
jgi:glycosyltransferase involved in cell wall biosynthesis